MGRLFPMDLTKPLTLRRPILRSFHSIQLSSSFDYCHRTVLTPAVREKRDFWCLLTFLCEALTIQHPAQKDVSIIMNQYSIPAHGWHTGYSTSVFLSSLVYKSYIKDIHSNKDNQSWLFVLLRIQAPWIYQILEIWILPILTNCTIF